MRSTSVFLCLLLVSCSGRSGLHPVQGKVLHKDGPAKGAIVVFHPKGANEVTSQRPSGVTGEDGSFTLTTGKDTGAPPGEYQVTIVWPAEPVKSTGKKAISTDLSEPSQPDRLGGKYADAKSSGLSARVTAGKNTLAPFELK